MYQYSFLIQVAKFSSVFIGYFQSFESGSMETNRGNMGVIFVRGDMGTEIIQRESYYMHHQNQK